MSFGLKKARATYQRATTTLFHDMMHQDVKVYVDDMIVKSRDESNHLEALKRFFERIRQFRLTLNPKKCTFGVTFGKLLGYMVSERGIKADPDKIRAILDMPTPRIEKEVKGFLEDQRVLVVTSSLGPPTPGHPLLLYLSVLNVALGCMLAQLDDSRKERGIYYLSKRMLEYETRYVTIECYCLALVWTTRRLRHYMTEYSVHLISHLDPLRYLFDRPALSIRGSIVTDHLASLPVSDGRAIDDDFSNEDVATVISLSKLLVGRFDDLSYTHLPRAQNQFANVLATLASMIDIPTDTIVRLLLIESRSIPAYYCLIDEAEFDDGLPWYHDIYQFLRLGAYPEAVMAKNKRALRQLTAQFVICGRDIV
ncbi:Retrovirus-related Pol polyprotein from transposon 17.6 [Vitis vinifera]|uniref:Retrovirus-related Pol polyprotein from transposon 17.6 n=1 Tax=Vitis vinifera TaxID=29760 RepID=A0A438BQA8_VITVI|nr:Retrovirus-related Pol polyprotein from transposon 17.6 [Vitis vinifera]